VIAVFGCIEKAIGSTLVEDIGFVLPLRRAKKAA